MATGPNYERMKSDRNIGLLMAPTGTATGVANTAAPTEAELAVGGASGFLNAAPSTSWNDYDFGVQESDRNSDPSLADDSTYEDFGQMNYGGGVSMYYPGKYHDPTNNHSNMYDLTKEPWTPLDIVTRIDGDKKNHLPLKDGDFVHTFRVLTDGEANSLEGSDALRRTVTMLPQGDLAVYTIVGAHTITALPPATAPWAAGKKARLRGLVQDRDYTSALTFTSSDAAVVDIDAGGFYEVTGTTGGTATITISDEAAGTSVQVAVTVA